MADQPNPTKGQQNFVLTTDAPRYATRIIATVSHQSIIFSFGVENPGNTNQAHMHTRVAMPMDSLESFKELLNRITSDLELKKTMKGIQYDQIPSDS